MRAPNRLNTQGKNEVKDICERFNTLDIQVYVEKALWLFLGFSPRLLCPNPAFFDIISIYALEIPGARGQPRDHSRQSRGSDE